MSERLAIVFVIVVVFGTIGFASIQRASDGPLNDIIPGGPLVAGELTREGPIDWDDELETLRGCRGEACSANVLAELQLVEPAYSRFTGIMVADGDLYVPCDLGFMWNRFEGSQRYILELIYWFKTWHEHALLDGRAVIRIDGKRYAGQLVRVTDTSLEGALRRQLETMAIEWLKPDVLGPRPTDEPNDIWFFRFDPGPGEHTLG